MLNQQKRGNKRNKTELLLFNERDLAICLHFLKLRLTKYEFFVAVF